LPRYDHGECVIHEFLDLPQLLSAAGVVRLPGSKSISNRVLLLAALAEGETEVRDLLSSDDTARMLEALKVLGVGIAALGNEDWLIKGCGGKFPVKQASFSSAMPARPFAH
jgi:3-phosphoshikimate 1-carboxyvinyltransferase